MRSRTRTGLILASVGFFLLGVLAIVGTVLRTFDQVGSISGDGSYSPPGRASQVVSTLAPVSAAVFLALSVVCAAGAVASYVVTEGVDRALARRPDAPRTPIALSDPEHLD